MRIRCAGQVSANLITAQAGESAVVSEDTVQARHQFAQLRNASCRDILCLLQRVKRIALARVQ